MVAARKRVLLVVAALKGTHSLTIAPHNRLAHEETRVTARKGLIGRRGVGRFLCTRLFPTP
jgi:hypothetical protein